MDREDVVRMMRDALPELSARYGFLHLDLFGSFARNESRSESDVDLLVTFQGEPTFARYMGLKEDLEMLVGRKVDLVTAAGLKPRIREAVLAELYRVA